MAQWYFTLDYSLLLRSVIHLRNSQLLLTRKADTVELISNAIAALQFCGKLIPYRTLNVLHDLFIEQQYHNSYIFNANSFHLESSFIILGQFSKINIQKLDSIDKTRVLESLKTAMFSDERLLDTSRN